jgi:hypothetical protein
MSPENAASCGSTSLERSETTDRKNQRGTAPQHRLHARVAKVRFWLIDVLKRADSETLQRRSVRLDFCGAFPGVHEGGSGEASVRLNLCRDRLCPTCQRIRGERLKLKLISVVRHADAPKFVTLTLKHRESPLASEIDRLFSAFRKLRKDRVWSGRVRGGVYVLEVKRNPKTARWHPHLHVLVDAKFIPQKQLSEAWMKATGDSDVVDIRAIHSQEQAAGYISSYATKGDDLTKWTAGNVIEYAEAMHGRRLIHTFGNLHNVACDEESEDATPQAQRRIATTTHLLHRAEVGDDDARFCVAVLAASGPKWALAFGVDRSGQALVTAPPTADEVRLALAWARLVDKRAWWAPPVIGRAEPAPPPPVLFDS